VNQELISKIRKAFDLLDAIMEETPSRRVADAANLLEDEIAELQK